MVNLAKEENEKVITKEVPEEDLFEFFNSDSLNSIMEFLTAFRQ